MSIVYGDTAPISCRDTFVEQIKKAGESLIRNADCIVPKDPKSVSEIHIEIDVSRVSIGTIEYSIKAYDVL